MGDGCVVWKDSQTEVIKGSLKPKNDVLLYNLNQTKALRVIKVLF